MSTVIRSCPSCKALILSDTDQCTECGHVFYERGNSEGTASPATPDSLKSASIEEPCPHCGEMVRSGLVRCWSCNGFMRADVAAKYRKLTTNPQPIIYSTIPPEKRTDYLPPRATDKDFEQRVVADGEGFSLAGGVESTPAADFDLDADIASAAAPAPDAPKADTPVKVAKGKQRKPSEADIEKPLTEGPDKPVSTTVTTDSSARQRLPAAEKKESSDSAPVDDSAARSPSVKPDSPAGRRAAAATDEDLMSMAIEEQKEVTKRRGQKRTERLKKQILVPCSCGAWIRVNEDQAGRTLRCRKCRQPVVVPGLSKKSQKSDKAAAAAAEKKSDAPASHAVYQWVEDAGLHVFAPETLVLKPGSLTAKQTLVDLAIDQTGIHIVEFGNKAKKKSLFFSFVTAGRRVDRSVRRRQVHEHVASQGNLQNLENVQLRSLSPSEMSDIRIVQPVAKVSESMFAGVPVFGEGRIAVFLPLEVETGKQTFMSFHLSAWRRFCRCLKELHGIELPSADSGVPDGEAYETLSCFLSNTKVEALRNQVYYQKDPSFIMELTGYRCASCGTAVSEEARKKAKLGGVKGRGIAKAKCPKCGSKMQGEALHRLTSSAET